MLESAVRDVPARVLKAACAAYVRKSRWFPTPADLLQAVDEAKRELGPSQDWERWRRLQWLAERAAQAERAEAIAADPVDPAEVEALIRQLASVVAA